MIPSACCKTEAKDFLVPRTLWLETVLLPDGWAFRARLHHEGGLITSIERGVDPSPDDERLHIGVPGLPNVHSHAFQRGMAGLAERRGRPDDDFWSWREVMYRFLDALGPEDVEAIAAQAYVEMLEAGFTRVGEFHYLHHQPSGEFYANPAELAERIGAAAAETGIALTLLPVFYAHASFGGAAPKPGQRRFITGVEDFAHLYEACGAIAAALPDATLGVAPHSLRAVTPGELTKILQLAPSGPVHIHAAEQVGEVNDCLAWSGKRPVEWLFANAPVDARWCLIHATHLTEAETAALAASGAVAGLCPVTEANLGDGIFPAAAYLAAGGAFGVGTDSNVLIGVAEELRGLEYSQRLLHRARNVLAVGEGGSVGGRLFAGALAGGARALGTAPTGLAVGAPLDLVSLRADHPSLVGRSGDALLDGWIFAAKNAVERVWRHGCKVVADGRHVEAEAVAARYRRVIERVLTK